MKAFDSAQQALGFVIAQTSHIEREVYNIKYPDITYAELIPVDTSAHPWARTVTYFSQDATGAAKFMNAGARDVPRVDLNREKHETAVEFAGIGYGYDLEEINQAQMLGISLDADKARAGRRASDRRRPPSCCR